MEHTTKSRLGIIPQPVSVRHGLFIAVACTSSVLGLIYLYLFAPVARLLDLLLGMHIRVELNSFLAFHRTHQDPLHAGEISIFNGVLELNTKNVQEIVTPIKDVVTPSADALLDDKLVETILLSGYSRFPVNEPHDPGSFIGLLLIKLLKYDSALARPVASFPLSILPEANPSIHCFQALNYFQTGRAHLPISRKLGKPGGAIGVFTLETSSRRSSLRRASTRRTVRGQCDETAGEADHHCGCSARDYPSSRSPSRSSERTPLVDDAAGRSSSIHPG
ncbi:hypothetical protein B0H19DRAFT_444462 [Mycena capillaripes]|nr:hypothetical protein B0H19DRAFT_444462 [Mycena capillaripes]